ncbi:hybrid sensor histidine kinase/response regulator [Undibacterium sp. Ji50W]|uniref:ATP-binding response regulator n=1 Tax=Undibacterium sp. Ji50W TaxID=3413041 RepID=UPI003BF12C9E
MLEHQVELELNARKQAEETTLAKSRFLAAASHDLRQPIHAQGLFLEVLARSELSILQREVLACVCSAAQASSEMLDTLLDFSRIEAGVIESHLRPFTLQVLLNKIENDLAGQADSKGIVYRSRETSTIVDSDPALVELVVRNLVSNAIRYTEQGGVLIGCRRRGGHLLLEIWDTGIGIHASQHQEIFLEFNQLSNPERDRRKGLGLGLAIADSLARKLGCELSLASRPGRGSVFRLALPVSDSALLPQLAADSVPDFSTMKDVRVLVIDDEEMVCAGMQRLLQSWGCDCTAAMSIDQAIASACARVPDLIISDYRLREQGNGAQAVSTLRTMCGVDIPALLITGDTAPERLREASASGIPLLHKPVAPLLLFRRMTELLETADCAR